MTDNTVKLPSQNKDQISASKPILMKLKFAVYWTGHSKTAGL